MGIFKRLGWVLMGNPPKNPPRPIDSAEAKEMVNKRWEEQRVKTAPGMFDSFIQYEQWKQTILDTRLKELEAMRHQVELEYEQSLPPDDFEDDEEDPMDALGRQLIEKAMGQMSSVSSPPPQKMPDVTSPPPAQTTRPNPKELPRGIIHALKSGAIHRSEAIIWGECNGYTKEEVESYLDALNAPKK